MIIGTISICTRIGKLEQRQDSFEDKMKDKFESIEYKLASLQKSIDATNAHVEKISDRLVDLSLYELRGSRSRKKAV